MDIVIPGKMEYTKVKKIQSGEDERKTQMRETILLFHFSDKDRRNRLTRALLPLRMKIREITKEDYGKPIGYLAGNKELASEEEVYTGEELPGELLVMAGLTSARIDQVLKAIRRSGILVPYKAVLTPSNQSWKVTELFEEIRTEHERMTGGGEETGNEMEETAL